MSKFPISREEVQTILANPEMMDGDTYDRLYTHYTNSGEMPYGIAKARTGDPDQWIYERLATEFAN